MKYVALTKETGAKLKSLLGRSNDGGFVDSGGQKGRYNSHHFAIVLCSESSGDKRACTVCQFDPLTNAPVEIDGSDALVTTLDGTGDGLESGTHYFALRSGKDGDDEQIFVAFAALVLPPFMRRGKLDGNLTVGGSATMSIWYWNGSAEADNGSNITVYDWMLGETLVAGKKVAATWCELSSRWYVTSAECP